MRMRSPLKLRTCRPLKARACSPLMARTYSPLKVIGTSTQGSTFMRKQEIDSSRGPVRKIYILGISEKSSQSKYDRMLEAVNLLMTSNK